MYMRDHPVAYVVFLQFELRKRNPNLSARRRGQEPPAVYMYCRCIIYASFIILVHCFLEMFLPSNSATPILACPALVSAGCQRAMQACAAMNFFGKFPGKRLGMLDSGCNELIIKLDEESRAFACDWNRDDVTVGDAAAGTFTTDGTATIEIAGASQVGPPCHTLLQCHR